MSAAGIVIRGAGELASGVAVRLWRCGYPIVMTEVPGPLAVRRLVSFSEAVYGGSPRIEGVSGRTAAFDTADFSAYSVIVVVDPGLRILKRLRPAAVLDARMLKRSPEPLVPRPPVLIGLGPGFTAPDDADFVIETHRGARLGEVIASGRAAADTGVPGEVGGQGRLRVIHAPAAGRLEPSARIGDLVSQDQILGSIGGATVIAPIGGMLRGLVHPEAELFPGVKVADIDPRGSEVDPALVSDKALAIGGGVLEALLRSRIMPSGRPRRGQV